MLVQDLFDDFAEELSEISSVSLNKSNLSYLSPDLIYLDYRLHQPERLPDI